MGHTSFQLSRRSFLKAGLSSAGALAISPAFLARAFAAGPVTVGDGPYGPISDTFDANGIALPEGFTSREIARGGSPVAGSTPPYVWHGASDGQATFPTISGGRPDGGWILVSNSEMPAPGAGGVSGVEFAADGTVERAYRVLAGTGVNCAGGPTPWGAWLSCEEHFAGQVHECDPTTINAGVARPAMGVFSHEAACVDPVGKQVYLTEDQGDGCLYRFTPDSYPDLSSGLLEVAIQGSGGDAVPGTLDWEEVPDPSAGIPLLNPDPPEMSDPTRHQVANAAHFDGGEGTWFDNGIVYVTTKGDGRVWTYDVASSQLDILYDDDALVDPPLKGVDNITVSPSGDIYVCEDGQDHDICLITPDLEITRFLKLDPVMHAGPTHEDNPVKGNETVGVVFSPDGTRMYFGAQRTTFGTAGGQVPPGVVYEVSGPFRLPAGDEIENVGGSGAPTPDKLAGGPRTSVARDLVAPRMRLRARRRRRIKQFLETGLPVNLELDELAGVDATLKVGRKLLARATPSVAVRDQVALALTPSAKAAALLEGRDEVLAKLRVVATDVSGNRTLARRTVRLRQKN